LEPTEDATEDLEVIAALDEIEVEQVGGDGDGGAFIRWVWGKQKIGDDVHCVHLLRLVLLLLECCSDEQPVKLCV